MVFRMGKIAKDSPRRVLIASANPLFSKGLQAMFQHRWGNAARVVGLTSTMEETLQALEDLQPDLVILDFDDRSINREEFLSHFVAGMRPMQVALVSLQETGGIMVYDRRSLTPSQAESWLGAAWLNSLLSGPGASGESDQPTDTQP
jgi:cytochrome c oxidase subunit II